MRDIELIVRRRYPSTSSHTHEITLQSDDSLGRQQFRILRGPERDDIPSLVQVQGHAPSVEQDDVVVKRSRSVSGIESRLHRGSGHAGYRVDVSGEEEGRWEPEEETSVVGICRKD